jgi:predicted metalloprotease with PDZ domain
MKKIILGLFVMGLLVSCGASKSLPLAENTTVNTMIDLVNVQNDRVKVVVDPGAFKGEEVIFHIPKTVPGTYSTDNYGQYIQDFKALDYKGNELNYTKTDENSWVIANGGELDKVEYWVNDTYDSEKTKDEPVFSPAGTNILANESFVLNLHGFVGYFKGFKEVPYELNLNVPQKLTPTTSLVRVGGDKQKLGLETYHARRYFEVIDNPIFYTKHPAESFKVNDITVNLAVHSPNGVYSASDLKGRMEKMMQAQKNFLGDINSTKEYNILLHLSTMLDDDAGGFGALEHHTSTVVVLPEAMPKENLEQAMVDVVSHEFFHIVTPLNVHSKEIQYFDFNDPKMSQHLWMYEGTTEYFANLFQIQQGLIDEQEFYERIMSKIANAKMYDDAMSFTKMSQNILEQPYEKNYANVYEKGALINMCLDIIIREQSGGEKGVLWLMKNLSSKYDFDTPFNDEDLFDEITALTYPEVRNFLDAHVSGDMPIDYNAFFEKVGLDTQRVPTSTSFFMKGEEPFIDVDQKNDNAIFVRKGIELNSFLKEIGLQGGDIIKEVNGTPFTLENVGAVIGQSFSWNEEKEIEIKIDREGEEMLLKGVAGSPMIEENKLAPMPEASEQQTKLRSAWMG